VTRQAQRAPHRPPPIMYSDGLLPLLAVPTHCSPTLLSSQVVSRVLQAQSANKEALAVMLAMLKVGCGVCCGGPFALTRFPQRQPPSCPANQQSNAFAWEVRGGSPLVFPARLVPACVLPDRTCTPAAYCLAQVTPSPIVPPSSPCTHRCSHPTSAAIACAVHAGGGGARGAHAPLLCTRAA